MDAYPQSNDSSDHKFLVAKLKYIDCPFHYKYLSLLNRTLSRLFFMKNEFLNEFLWYPVLLVLSN